jgi:membrane protease YdiL (CAAX protease family)
MADGTLPPLVRRTHWRNLVAGRPFAAFVALAYLWSWLFWTIAALVPGALGVAAHYIGGFGPLLSAVIVVWAQGRSVSGWLKGLFKWRLGPTWYAFALGFPAFLVAVTSLGYLLLGHDLSFSMLPDKLLAYAPALLLLVLVGGGNEEPGWRGFGLGELQRMHSPVVATLILGSIWEPVAELGLGDRDPFLAGRLSVDGLGSA